MSPKLDSRTLVRLDQALNELNHHRPLSQSILNKLREQFTLEMTYHSNAIEGNRLTLKETLLVLREGITIKGKNLQEHLEAKNHEEAMHFLFDIVNKKDIVNLSHHLIRQLHQLVVKDTEKKIAGNYRNSDVRILGSKHKPPSGYQVQEEMDLFLKWLTTENKKQHPVILAALAHHRFVAIHPFEDGNGRTGRLLMNLLLMRKGYPIAVILKNDRSKYYKALDQADQGQTLLIERIVSQAVERSLTIYLKTISKSTPDNELLPLSTLAKSTKHSAKYLNLLSRTGQLNAQKIGRNWHSSLEAIEVYEKTRIRKRARERG